jgi:hypothetical protein
MNCGAIDVGCMIAAYLDPILTFWGGIGAFIKAWWWVGYGAVCLIAGAHLGKGKAYAIVTAGLVALALRFWPQKADEPAYETGEPDPPPKPKKRKTLLGN